MESQLAELEIKLNLAEDAIDALNHTLFRQQQQINLLQAQMRELYRFVIFDLSDCKFIDSSAIGAFIQMVGWLRKRGGEFIVTNIVDSVRKVFTITRLENHIRVAHSMEEARDIVESIISATSR